MCSSDLVAKCEVLEVWREPDGMYLCEGGEVGFRYRPSSDWAQGGPIIDREKIELAYRVGVNWTATRIEGPAVCEVTVPYNQKGSPQLIAAMRCYVASKLGDDIELPEELK